jgi:NADH-quinone oxidoreductase subunit L
MSMLVVADGFVGLFIGWELVGACSYLLIGFWFTRPAAANAAVKAFLTTRVGDVGLLLALALLWREVGDLSYAPSSQPPRRSRPESSPRQACCCWLAR